MIKRILFFSMLISSIIGFAQKQGGDDVSTKSKKAKQYYLNAKKFYYYNDAQNASLELLKALKEDSTFYEAYVTLAQSYMDMRQYENAEANYKKAIEVSGENVSSIDYFDLAKSLFAQTKYEPAASCFREFLKLNNGVDNPNAREAKGYIVVAEYRADMMKHPVNFNPINMGENINSPFDEYLPSLTADENVILITRRDIRNMDYPYTQGNSHEDFYEARKVKGQWQKAFNVGSPINTPGNEGAECISADGRMVFFSIIDRQGGFGSSDIYMSRRSAMGWSEPENLGSTINSEAWDTQPSFSSDGKTLFYVSTRKGGIGGSDIWKSELQSDGSWSTPINMGPKINTRFDENSPFIHPDAITLYFSSKGLLGMGGFDIFYTRLSGNEWGDPQNIGYPINTLGDDNSLIISPSGELAYFSSKREGGYGFMDLYYFELYKGARPSSVTYFKGKVYDASTFEPLEAQFELIDLGTQQTKIKSNSETRTGEFFVPLATNSNYALNVSKKGYLFYSQNFSLLNRVDKNKPYIMDVPLQPIGDNEIVVLNNIFFDTDKFDLKSESLAELEKLFSFLKNNPTLKIEVRGHTDNVGNDALNLTLSNNRAKSVYDYLLSKGIPSTRLSYKGYGETTPIAANDTEEGRQKNRRTEFKIIGK